MDNFYANIFKHSSYRFLIYNMAHYLLFLFLALSYLQTTTISFRVGLPSSVRPSPLLCREEERQALLSFKGDLEDPSSRLSSWVDHECCRWRGVSCNNLTGRVAMLNLGNPYINGEDEGYDQSSLSGNINPSLFSLNDLYYLNLSGNSLGKQVPNLFGKLQGLRYLDLSNTNIGGGIPPSLGNLSKLNYLDLSFSFESDSNNLNWISQLSSLKYLNLGVVDLSSIGLSWLHLLPPSLLELHLRSCQIQTPLSQLTSMNLTSLSVLDLANNYIPSFPSWICNLTHLKQLDLGYNQFTSHVPSELANLKSLEVLNLEGIGIRGQVPIFIGTMCNLRELYLSSNSFVGGLDKLLNASINCTISRLESFDIHNNMLDGQLPTALGMLKNMQRLYLYNNHISGPIPDFFGNMSSLESLDLSGNQMNGSIPESLGQLSNLVDLDLSYNSWEGNLSESHFINLSRLKYFKVSTDRPMSLVFNVTNDWIPPFQLDKVDIRNCNVGTFGLWLQSQIKLVDVSLVNTGISDSIPEEWFMKISPQLQWLAISRNQIRARLPSLLNFPKLYAIDLSHNLFEGPLPYWSSDAVQVFNLENNLFSGPIPSNYDQLLPNLEELYLSENNLIDRIPSSVCNMSRLSLLVLRSNYLSGQLPQEWNRWEGILVVDVADNKLSGKIPTSMGVPGSLWVLNLSSNNFSGSIPSSLFQNCTQLKSIDLGDNRFTGSISLQTKQFLKQSNNNCGGTIPSSLLQNCSGIDLGDNRFKGSISRLNNHALSMLRLRSNSLSGQIPHQLCSSFPSLHIIDFGHNNFSGTIPKCLIDLSTLVYGNLTDKLYTERYYEKASLTAKGQELVYNTTLDMVNIIDLSSNNLDGEIPEGIWGLLALGTLNLSRNQLSGSIPANIGNMKQLETLDLSNNNLSGSIPQSFSSLTSLSHLNLSFNNLSGRIPTSIQLQSIQSYSGPSIYAGNPNLCGLPLSTKCSGDSAPSPTNPVGGLRDEAGDDNGRLGLYVSIVVGFTLGFWGVCGTLLVKHSWRYAYFRFFDSIKDKMALGIALKVAHFKRMRA